MLHYYSSVPRKMLMKKNQENKTQNFCPNERANQTHVSDEER